MDELVLSVTGMTCEHCVRAVTSAALAVGGVRETVVDLVPSGTSTVRVRTAPGAPGDDVAAGVSRAITDEGYDVVGLAG